MFSRQFILLNYFVILANSAQDCLELFNNGFRTSGVYSIEIFPGHPENVSCDMGNGGGWTIFQRRHHSLVSFDQNRFQYQAGFGFAEDDYWLGLDNINVLTTKDQYVELRIDLWDCQNNQFFEHYSTFSVDDSASNYKLTVAGPSGSAGDAFLLSNGDNTFNQNGMGFTTFNFDNDTLTFGNCASIMKGGWWFSGCGQANLNGKYIVGCKYQPGYPYGIVWGTLWNESEFSAYRSEMKLRKGDGIPPTTPPPTAPPITTPSYASDCYDLQHVFGNTVSGVYSIKTPGATSTIQVFCDLQTDGGGWTVFQRRFDGSVDFTQKSFNQYQYGFGQANGEYWLGLENIYQLSTKDIAVQLRIDLTDCSGIEYYETYQNFKLGSAQKFYALYVSAGYGTAGDSFNIPNSDPRFNQNGMGFSTIDVNHDGLPFDNCAKFFDGGWWYNACGNAHLNSQYYPTCTYESTYENGITWNSLRQYYSFKTAKMMLRKYVS